MRRARILKRRQMQKKKNKKDVKLVEIFEEGKRRFTGWKDQEDCPICFEPLGSLNRNNREQEHCADFWTNLRVLWACVP